MRYVSRRRDLLRTPAERIEAIRKTIPPPPGRRARNAYISKDDFATLIGAGRSTVISWTTGKSFPNPHYQEVLAEMSQRRFEPADFADPNGVSHAERRAARRLEPRLDALEEQVARLAHHIFGSADAQEQ